MADIAARRLRFIAAKQRVTDDELFDAEELLDDVEGALRVLPYSPRRWAEAGAAREAARAILSKGSASYADDIADPRQPYERALEVNDALSLDPLVQLSDREVAAIRAAIERLGGPLGTR
jgi:hypothetical protein